MAANPRRRIVATITLEEEGDSEHGYKAYIDQVETKITIQLPVPNADALPSYLSEQIRGFLDIATGPKQEPVEPLIDDTPPGSDDDSEPADEDVLSAVPR